MMNGAVPRDPPVFMSSNVRRVLRVAHGEKLSAREITIRLGSDPGGVTQPSFAMMDVIRALARLKERGEVQSEFPTPARPEVTYWIEPSKEKCGVCGERECRTHV
jgi:hypothetical protein